MTLRRIVLITSPVGLIAEKAWVPFSPTYSAMVEGDGSGECVTAGEDMFHQLVFDLSRYEAVNSMPVTTGEHG